MEDGGMEDGGMEDGDGAHDLAVPETTFQDAVPEAFRAQLTDVVDTYLNVRDALLTSDEAAARSHLQELQDRLGDVEMAQLDNAPHDAWMQDLRAMESHLAHVSETDGLEPLRAEFSTLSLVLAYSIQRFGIEGIVYRQYCPMAFDGEGAYWISDKEEIQNPYLPENMPGCGDVIERLDA